MEWLTADWERKSFLAASVKLPVRARAEKARNWRLSIGVLFIAMLLIFEIQLLLWRLLLAVSSLWNRRLSL